MSDLVLFKRFDFLKRNKLSNYDIITGLILLNGNHWTHLWADLTTKVLYYLEPFSDSFKRFSILVFFYFYATAYFLSVNVSDLYNCTLQTIVFVTFILRFLLILFERSYLLLLNGFLANSILLLLSDHIASFFFTPVSAGSHHFGLFDIYFHSILFSGLAQRVHFCQWYNLRLRHHRLIVGLLHIL